MGILRQLSFWKRSASAVLPFEPEDAAMDGSAEAKPSSPGTQAKLSSTSQSTACSDDATHRPELRTPTPGSSPSESTCSCATGPANASTDRALSPYQEADVEDGCHSLRSTAVAPSLSPRRSEGPIDFNMQQIEIFAAVAAEFGEETASSLQSSKWDKRLRGLQSISAVLNGRDLEGMAPPGSTGALSKGLFRERAAAWRVSCLILNQVLKDKVIPVNLAALELFRDTFENIDVSISSAQVQQAAAVLIQHVMARIGDSNVRLHERARCNLVFTASRQLLGLGGVLSRLQQRLEMAPPKGGERTKLHFGVLDTVAEIVKSYPESASSSTSPHTWTLEIMTSFITAGLEESLGPRVRNSAVALAATVYRLLGPAASDSLVSGLRPAKQALLREKFREIDEEGLADDGQEEESEGGDVRPDLDGCLQVCSALPSLPGAVPVAGEEECLMDGILEETGLVFQGAGIQNEGQRRRSLRKSVSFCPEDDIVEVVQQEEDEELLLDHEVWALGIDVEGIDDQEALLREILMGSGDEDEDEDDLSPSLLSREQCGEALSVDAC